MSKQNNIDLYKLTKKLKEIEFPRYGKMEIIFHHGKIADILKTIHIDKDELKDLNN